MALAFYSYMGSPYTHTIVESSRLDPGWMNATNRRLANWINQGVEDARQGQQDAQRAHDLADDQARTQYGNDGNNTLDGTNAKDVLFGLAGDDVLNGQAGDDTLEGGLGNDRLEGGLGRDVLRGGLGNDTYVGIGKGDVIEDSGGLDTIEVSGKPGFKALPNGIENLIGGGKLSGNGLANVMQGGGGVDTFLGLDGDDTLIGLAGADKLSGGGGADVFRYEGLGESGLGKGADKLLGFESGVDDIDLRAFGPATLVTFANGLVHVDVGGDGAIDFDLALGRGASFDPVGDVILA